ncbi:MAG TPA: ketoacyl-ACP synthase III [Anaerolineae bacterium]|nr:ketoacyl-ACP synthase III [Anaerolineae bacterium]
MKRYSHITGWGMVVPERILTNEEITQTVDTTDEWIRTRTGVQERRIAAEDETTASLASGAALKALTMAGIKPSQVDMIIVSTSSPEHTFPSTASIVQDEIGAIKAGAFDLSAACTGFIYALDMVSHAITSGSIDIALVIGAETLSKIVNWKDRNTCILFGDGAGAFVLQALDKPGGFISSVLRSDGSGADLLTLPAGGSKLPASEQTVRDGLHYIHMQGREVFRFATRVMAKATLETVEKGGLTLDDISLIIPHQANQRIIESAAKKLKLPMDKFFVNLDKYGNTSTASIPIATCEAVEADALQPGDMIVFVGFGGGLTWGSALIQWSGPQLEVKPIRTGWYQFWAGIRSFLLKILRRIEGLLSGLGE